MLCLRLSGIQEDATCSVRSVPLSTSPTTASVAAVVRRSRLLCQRLPPTGARPGRLYPQTPGRQGFSSRSALEGEHKQVTVLFFDRREAPCCRPPEGEGH